MDDYHEFWRDHATKIKEWRKHWSPSYVSITHGGVTSGGITTPFTSTQVIPPPSFNPIMEFFLRLKNNYQGVKTKKLRSLQEFERKTSESLREAYTRMQRLIAVTQGVTEAQAVQFWYGILDKELRRKARDVTLMNDDSPTLAHVFALSEKIEFNMVEERVTSGFNRDIVTTSRGQQSHLVLVEVGVVEVRYDLSQVLEGRVHKDNGLHSLVNNRDSLVGHVVVFIFERIVHRRVVDGLWLMDFNRHKFNVIIVAGSATLMSVVLTFTQN